MNIPDGTENLEEYIKKADAAMYQERSSTRRAGNRIPGAPCAVWPV